LRPRNKKHRLCVRSVRDSDGRYYQEGNGPGHPFPNGGPNTTFGFQGGPSDTIFHIATTLAIRLTLGHATELGAHGDEGNDLDPSIFGGAPNLGGRDTGGGVTTGSHSRGGTSGGGGGLVGGGSCGSGRGLPGTLGSSSAIALGGLVHDGAGARRPTNGTGGLGDANLASWSMRRGRARR
jgi:hypothetical protein